MEYQLEQPCPIPRFAQSTCNFGDGPLEGAGMAPTGDAFIGTGRDPQIHLVPREPLAGGWWQFVLRMRGDAARPCVYLDAGAGYSEDWTVPLAFDATQEAYRAIAWLPLTVKSLRLDPDDGRARFFIEAFLVDPLTEAQLESTMASAVLASPPRPAQRRPVRWRAFRRLIRRPDVGKVIRGREPGVFFSTDSHLCGVSLLLNGAAAAGDTGFAELYSVDGLGLKRVLGAKFDPASVNEGWVHLYWDPIEDSARRFYLLVARVSRTGMNALPESVRNVRTVKPFHSAPEPTADLPQAILFSPVTQCNLNCTHCISRPSREKFAAASEHVWEQIAIAARGRHFINFQTDYSGDILFAEAKHGMLSRLAALDVPLKIDTNANCLDEPIVETLLRSRVVQLGFSVDSMDPQVYAKVRKGSIPLDQVLEKIARFMARKRESRREILTLMSFTLMRSTASTIKPALAFAKAHGIDFVLVHPLIAFTDDMVGEIIVWDDKAYEAVYGDLMAEAVRLGVALVMKPPVRRWIDREGHAPCRVPWGSTVVLGNGDVMACCVPGTRIANLEGRTLADIWNGPEYREFRTRVNSNDPPAPCRSCPMSRLDNNPRAYAPAVYLQSPQKIDRPVKVVNISKAMDPA